MGYSYVAPGNERLIYWCVLGLTNKDEGPFLEVLCIKIIKCICILSKILYFGNTLNIRNLHSCKACYSGSGPDGETSHGLMRLLAGEQLLPGSTARVILHSFLGSFLCF